MTQVIVYANVWLKSRYCLWAVTQAIMTRSLIYEQCVGFILYASALNLSRRCVLHAAAWRAPPQKCICMSQRHGPQRLWLIRLLNLDCHRSPSLSNGLKFIQTISSDVFSPSALQFFTVKESHISCSSAPTPTWSAQLHSPLFMLTKITFGLLTQTITEEQRGHANTQLKMLWLA